MSDKTRELCDKLTQPPAMRVLNRRVADGYALRDRLVLCAGNEPERDADDEADANNAGGVDMGKEQAIAYEALVAKDEDEDLLSPKKEGSHHQPAIIYVKAKLPSDSDPDENTRARPTAPALKFDARTCVEIHDSESEAVPRRIASCCVRA